MVTKVVFLLVTILISLISIFPNVQDQEQEQQIHNATVMITITVPELEATPATDEALPIPPDEYRTIARPDSYKVAEGLGTLVTGAGELLIITHDHWSVLDSQLGVVSISNGSGRPLVELDLFRFKQLIRYRDGGTMVLTAPKEISIESESEQEVFSADSLQLAKLSAGDTVSLVHRQREGKAGVTVMQAIVVRIGDKDGSPVLRLRSSEGESIIGGDSGGGVWFEGELVANTWTTIVTEDVQTGERRATDGCIAALISFIAII